MKKKEIKKLDLLWSKAVKVQAKFRCEYCHAKGIGHGGSAWLNSCHIVGRRYRATRWGCWIKSKYDLAGFCGCYEHHRQYDEHGWQEQDIINEVIGQKRKENLQKIAKHSVTKHQDFEEIKEILDGKIQELQES